MDVSDQDLLQRFANHQDERAFDELVRRYLNLVHATALRTTAREDLARDVAQNTFVRLAQRAGAIPGRVPLTAWLHRTCRSLAVDLVRTEARRRKREANTAAFLDMNVSPADPQWTLLAPVVDGLVDQLGEQDRKIVLLRYYENRSYSAAGEALGLQEQATRKRAERALERLRKLLRGRGITTTTTALAMLLPSCAAGAAPAGLALSVARAAREIAPLAARGIFSSLWKATSFQKAAAAGGGLLALLLAGGLLIEGRETGNSETGAGTATDQARRTALPALLKQGSLPGAHGGKEKLIATTARKTVTKQNFDESGRVTLSTVYRVAGNDGHPVNAEIFDGKGVLLFRSRFGYSKQPGANYDKLVEEQMFDAREIRTDSTTGEELPFRRFVYTYDADSTMRKPMSIDLVPEKSDRDLFGAGPAGLNFFRASE